MLFWWCFWKEWGWGHRMFWSPSLKWVCQPLPYTEVQESSRLQASKKVVSVQGWGRLSNTNYQCRTCHPSHMEVVREVTNPPQKKIQEVKWVLMEMFWPELWKVETDVKCRYMKVSARETRRGKKKSCLFFFRMTNLNKNAMEENKKQKIEERMVGKRSVEMKVLRAPALPRPLWPQPSNKTESVPGDNSHVGSSEAKQSLRHHMTTSVYQSRNAGYHTTIINPQKQKWDRWVGVRR